MADSSSQELIDLGPLADLPVGETVEAQVGEKKVLVFQFPPGEVHVWEAICPHMGTPLEKGDCEGAVCICPFHGWQFNLRSGEEMMGLDGLQEIECEVRGERVWVKR